MQNRVITTELVFNIIKERSSTSILDIRNILVDERYCSLEDFRLSDHCAVGGIISSMIRCGLIKCMSKDNYYKEFVAV